MNTENIQQPIVFNSIYFLNTDLSSQLFLTAISRCLYKAEALAFVATTIDTETISHEIMDNYLWALSDIIHEARFLYDRSINKKLF